MKLSRLFFVSLMFAGGLFAHRINVFAYQEKDKIYLSGYFSGGARVVGGKVTVYDDKGNIITRGVTDKDGEFSFSTPNVRAVKIILDAGGGHYAETTIPVETGQRPVTKKSPKNSVKRYSKPVVSRKTTEAPLTAQEIEDIIDDTVNQKFKILITAVEHLRTRIYFSEVVAGIGYILGLMGITLYFMSRKKR